MELLFDLLALLILIFFLIGVNIGFVVVNQKCFFEERKKLRNFILLFLSPSVIYIPVRIAAIYYYYHHDYLELGAGFYLTFITLLFLMCAFQMFIYLKFVKPKNISMAIFLYLCCLMFTIYSDIIEQGFGMSALALSMYINNFLTIVMAVVFYVMVISPFSKLTKTKQERGMSVFVLIPAFAVAVKLALMLLHERSEDYILNAAYMNTLPAFTENEEQFRPYFSNMIYTVRFGSLLYLVASFSILITFVVFFAVIVRTVIHLNEINRQKDEIHEMSVEIMEALAHTIDAKDKYTNGHSIRVARYSRLIAERMKLSPETCETIYYMGLLHDIGKIGVPNEIINSPSRLTDEQYEIIKRHPVTGSEILSEMKCRPELCKGARWHHERFDGKGYPDKLSGDQIPLEARIIAVADSYDAMTSNRSYRRYLPQETVRAEIVDNRGTQFDPAAADAMIAIIDEDRDYLMHEMSDTVSA